MKKIYSRDGTEEGIVLGETSRPCFEGCCGTRLAVRWEDKRITYPCSHGIVSRPDGSEQIR